MFKKIILVLAALSMLPIFAASAQTEVNYYPDHEEEIVELVNALRAEHDLEPLDTFTNLTSNHMAYRDCIVNYNYLRLENGLGVKHKQPCVSFPGVASSTFAPPLENLGSSTTEYPMGSIALMLYYSTGHRAAILSDADYVIPYVACSSDGTTLVVLGFGSYGQNHPSLNHQPAVSGLSTGSGIYDTDTYHGCSNSGSLLEPAGSWQPPASSPPTSSIPGEPVLNPDVPQDWYRYSVARLYVAFFNRYPDEEGWAYWNRQYVNGLSLGDMAYLFSTSEEFQNRYGSLKDQDYLALVYENVLGRGYDQEGYNYWMLQMWSGNVDRGELMLYFSDSQEFKRTAAPTLTGGCWTGNVEDSYNCAAPHIVGG